MLHHADSKETWPGVGHEKGCRNETDTCFAAGLESEQGTVVRNGNRPLRAGLCDTL